MKHKFVFIFFCAGLCCIVTGLPTKSQLSRERRHFAAMKTTDYATRIALQRIALQRHLSRCLEIGCGLVDIVASGKKKRESPSVERFSNSLRELVLSNILADAKSRS